MSKDTTIHKYPSIHHSFDINLATKLGSVDLAIFLHHIQYWLEYNMRSNKNFREGKYWTFQTFQELHSHFPYWSVKQLRLIVDKLTKAEILIKGNFNDNRYDHTTWYSLDFEKVESMCPNGQIEEPIRADRKSPMGTSIKDNKQDNKEQQQGVVVFYSCIKDRKDLTEDEKRTLTTKYTEERILLALQFAKINPPTQTLIQLLIWHCNQNKPPIADPKKSKTDPKQNKLMAELYKNNYKSKTYTLEFLSKHVEFVACGAQCDAICIRYDELGFQEKFLQAIRKCEFYKEED